MPSKYRTPKAARILAPAQGCVLAAAILSGTQAGAQTADLGLRTTLESDTQAEHQDPQLSPGANYGKRRAPPDPKKAYAGQRKAYAHPLPPLATSTAPSMTRRGARAAPDAVQPPPTEAVTPRIPMKTRPRIEANPYAPLGIGVGSLRLTPYVSVDSGYDSNPARATGASVQGSRMLRAEVGGAIASDWSVHELKGEFKAGYAAYADVDRNNQPDAQGRLALRLDATRDTALDFELRSTLTTQRPGSTELTATSVKSRPIEATYGGSAGVTQHFNRLEIGLHGTLDRTHYGDATLLNGSTLPLSQNDYNAYGVKLRTGYEVTPGVKPFVEVQADARRRDEALDGSGFARNSNGVALKAGTTLELTRTLTGEIAGGYAQRSYADARLSKLSGETLDGSLIWSATPLTTVTLRAQTALAETTVANASGAVTRTYSAEVSHALLRNLTLAATGSIGTNDYQGISLHETTLTGGLRAEYSLTRSLVVRGSFTQERLKSSAAGSDYTANVFLLGLKLQR